MLNLMMFLFQDHSYIPQCVGLLKLAAPRNGKSTMALDQICPFLGMFYLHYVAYLASWLHQRFQFIGSRVHVA